MKKLLALTLLLFAVSGCTVNPVQVAADAAFCSSAESVLQSVNEAYENQVVDSEFLSSAAEFLSGVTEPLSDGLGDDVGNLLEELSSSAPVSESRAAIDELLIDIGNRCEEVGVEFQ